MKHALLAAALLMPTVARADDAQNTQPTPPHETQAEADAELARMAAQQELQEEDIVIFDERPDKPFDRDTEVRLTGEQLAARGATDLGTALALLPDVTVRDAGRGGFNIDIRGQRKGGVVILVDGVTVTDPFYGTFDVSTIPITDIVQIRVATTPLSPLDGVGGPGGVVEVLTRDAIGPQLVVARATADTLPTFGITGSARAALAKHLALRVSASGLAGARDLPLPAGHTLAEDRHAATGATRLEYRDGARRLAVDGFLDNRHYIAPPADTGASDITMVDNETSARGGIKYDDKLGKTQVQAEGFVHYLARRSIHFPDFTLANESATEDLHAWRTGGSALVTRPFARDFRWAASLSLDHDDARDSTRDAAPVQGSVTVIEPAADLQYERGTFRVDAAAGAALPFGVDARAWPEGKLVAKYKPLPALEVTATAARKGRVPTLRERFDPIVGNPALRPEQSWVGELRGVYQLGDRVRVEAAPYVRYTTGSITNVVQDDGSMRQENLDRVNVYGADTSARAQVHRLVEVGGSFGYLHQHSSSPNPVLAANPINRLPSYRADGWVQVAPERHVSLLARARYFGESVDQTGTIPGYTLFELGATVPLTKAYLFVVRCDDLTNVAPETRTGYHTAGRVVYATLQGSWE